MDKIRRMKMEGKSNEDIFSIYTEYVKDEIAKDIRDIYEKEPRLVNPEEPWVFRLEDN